MKSLHFIAALHGALLLHVCGETASPIDQTQPATIPSKADAPKETESQKPKDRSRLGPKEWRELIAAAKEMTAEPPPPPPKVNFGRFPLPIQHTRLSAGPGIPTTKENLNSPVPWDFPPFVSMDFEDAREYPAFKKGARYFQPAGNSITVYRLTDVERAPYKTIQFDIARLKELLKERPKTVPVSDEDPSLPDYPPRNAGHFLHAKIAYVDMKWGSGLFYLTQFTQESEYAFANNEELTYLFQGLSKDGNFYVSADIRVMHPKLPAGIDSKPKPVPDRAQTDAFFLGKQADDSFTPSLKKVREWIGTLEIE